jgi:nitrate/TMAO reductase-like tetraheme cytochrome c subunit
MRRPRFRPGSPALLLALPAGVAAALAALAGCVSFDDLARTEEETPTAARCGECHRAVYDEWLASPHAAAFVSADFKARTDGGTLERCLPCHAPAEMPPVEGRPVDGLHDPALKARSSRRDEGVHCIACHRLPAEHGEAPAEMAGPLPAEALVEPHPVRDLAAWYRDARFCGRCHEDTLAEWKGSPGAAPCQSCHMPAVTRKVTQPSGILSGALVALEDEHPLRAHDFSARAALAESGQVLGSDFLEVQPLAGDGPPRIRLVNRLPHAIPTGAFGAGSILVEVRGAGASAVSRELTVRRGGALGPGAAMDIDLPVSARGGTAIVEARRPARPPGAPLVLWRREVLLPPRPDGDREEVR